MDDSAAFCRRLRQRLLAIAAAAALPAAAAGCNDDPMCLKLSAARTTCPSPQEAKQLLGDPSCEERLVSIDSEAELMDDVCCYDVTVESRSGCVVEGRPLSVGGAPRAARPVRGRSGWGAAVGAPRADALPAAAREALAEHWTRAALAEHAAIAEHARCAIELLAAGAPAELVAAAQAAALDEVEHARIAFSLASAYAGEPVGPSALPLGSALELRNELAALAAAAVEGGCVNETLAAVLAAEQRAQASDPAVRAALDRVVDDEARHAELAWRTVRWAIEAGGEPVRRAVAAAFAAACTGGALAARGAPMAARDASMGDGQGGSNGTLSAHGLLGRAEAQAIVDRAIAEIVVPCANALL